MSARLLNLYESLIIKHPKLTLAIIALLLMGLAAGLPRMKLDASADSLTLEHDAALDYYREITSRYQTGDFLVVTYTPHADLFSDQALNTLQSLRNDLREVEGVASATTILDVPLLYSPPQSLPDIVAMDAPRTLMTPGVDREMARREFQQSPIYRDTLVSSDGLTTVIQLNLDVDNRYLELVRERDRLRLKRDRQGLTEAEAARLEEVSEEFREYRTERAEKDRQRIEDIRTIVAGYRDRAELFLGGASMITTDMIAFIKSDLVTFGSAVLVFIIAMLAIIFRQPRFVILPFITCVTVVTMMLGYLSWVDWRITVISNNFVSLLLILTLALTIYLVVRYRELHAKHPDWSQQQLVLEDVRLMARPCLYTVLTTVVAFISLVVSDIKPVIDFGWMMTMGLSLAFIIAFTLLPASLVLMKKTEPKEKSDKGRAREGSRVFTEHFARFTEKHGGSVLVVSVIAAIAAVYGIANLDVENRPIDYFHESTEIYQGMTVIDRQLGGTTPMDIILDAEPTAAPPAANGAEVPFAEPSPDSGAAGEDDPFALPDSQPEIGDSFAEDPFADDPFTAAPEGSQGEDPFAEDSFAEDLFTEDPFAEDGGTEAAPAPRESYWFSVAGLSEIEQLHDYLESLPEVGRVQSLATAYKVIKDVSGGPLNDFELAVMQNQLPEAIKELLIDPYLSYDANQARISLRVQESDPNLARRKLPDKIRGYAVEEIGLEPEQVHFTGLLVLYNNMLESLFHSQIVTLGAVFLGIMLMFLVLFRNFLLSVVAIIPNMLAASVVLGSMGIFGVPLDLMNIMVAAITVGMGVDHAIHYIHRYKQEFAIDQNYRNAMHRSHQSIGRAMYYTAITIIVGFSVLALSKFIPSIYFGLLTSLAMFAAILGSLTLLPKLILLTKPLGPGV
jgi:uncharacterized protein